MPDEAPENFISSREKKIFEKEKKKKSIPFCFYQNVLTDPEKRKAKKKKKGRKKKNIAKKKKKKKKSSDKPVSIFQFDNCSKTLSSVPVFCESACVCVLRGRRASAMSCPTRPPPGLLGTACRRAVVCVLWSMFTGCKYHFYTPHQRPT